MIDYIELINTCPPNATILDAIAKCYSEVTNHEKIVCSVSGGSDSDIMMDLIIRCGGKDKTNFVFFNTGLEYEATKNQIKALNEKYGVEIKVLQPIKPIPLCVKEHGVPFWSKQVSEMINRLQSHGFQWEDEPFEQLLAKYPKCKAALRWWCNEWGDGSKFNIKYVPYLKEFIIANPPDFRISNKCCHYAKKEPAKRFTKSSDCDLNCTGVRKSEGGARATAYKTCFTTSMSGADQYRPLFWMTDEDKAEYDKHYGIRHSDCYEVWGMKRTGCAGCPFARNYEEELELVKIYEPKFYKAMNNIFGKSYEYRRKFEQFRDELKSGR
jgi:3'-phosphoadenosine 5'-phosphosulfate sulfotransferase (PAPS reductase)/FAD synthetase